MKVVVVGASSGLGRSLAVGLAERGAQVAVLARRQERLVALAEEIGNGAVPLRCDVTDPASVDEAVAGAAEALGGIDGLVYTSGVGPMQKIEDLDPETWHHAFDTNVMGASLVTAAALPHLVESNGSAVYLSSTSGSYTPAWPGLAAYTVTKAALDKLVEAWRAEHPHVGFCRVVVGECPGGEGENRTAFNEGWDPDLAGKFAPIWFTRNYMSGALMDVEELVKAVDAVLAAGSSAYIPSITVVPRPPA